MLKSDESKILIVEDDPATAAIHRRCLERGGLAVVTAQTAEEVAAHRSRRRCEIGCARLSAGRRNNRPRSVQVAQGRRAGSARGAGDRLQPGSHGHRVLAGWVCDFVTKSPDYLDYLPEAIERVLQQVGTERQLAESETRLSAIIRSSQDAVMATDEEQRITLFNPAAEEIFRCPAEQALGGLLTRFIPDVLSTPAGVGAFRAERSGRRADGTTVPLEVTVSPPSPKANTSIPG